MDYNVEKFHLSHMVKVKSALTLCYKSTYGHFYRQESIGRISLSLKPNWQVFFIKKIKTFYAFEWLNDEVEILYLHVE